MIRTGETGKTNHFRLSAIGAAVLASIVLVLVTVTTKPAEAAFPGGKGKIAFARYQSQGPDDNSPSIWVMNGDGSGQTDVTTTTGNDTQPAWSADGMKIVHTCFRLLPSNEDICTMSQDGSNLVRITDDTGVIKDNSPAWSPDGTKIVFASTRNVNNLNPEGDFELWTMDSNGSNPVQLTLNNSFDGDPAWSPDGTKIAFTSDRDGDNEIFAMNTSGGSVSRYTNNAASDRQPAWSPDGARLAFTSNRDGNDEVYALNSDDGRGQTNLTRDSGADFDPAWSPDGERIAFVSRIMEGNEEIYVMNADGTGQTRLTFNTNRDDFPDWQPDATAPTGTVVINGGAGTTRKVAVTLALQASDPPPDTGVASMRIANSAGALSSAPWESFAASKSWKLSRGGGIKTVHVQFRDGAGNISAVATDTIKYRR